ncbi:hypothetical protein WJX84_002581 [Apatococcus fuscideae]|uniref:Uncharacterized protein n=1 Tax=Apatococcus fuscideae TaxID=2026836 RepID=A0AAW1STU4_9CHLO
MFSQLMCFTRCHSTSSFLYPNDAGAQVTVYDDEHMGDFIGMVVHFTNDKTDHAQGGELATCCWVSTDGWSRHPHGDACLAVAGADANISVISVVDAQVVRLLKGHRKEVLDLAACASIPGLLASLSRDGTARLWDVPSETCILSHSTDSNCLALDPGGKLLALGGRKGCVHLFSVPEGKAQASLQKLPSKLQSACLTETMDCLEFLDASRLCAKAMDGRMAVWDVSDGQQLASWRVPGCNAMQGAAGRSRFGATPCGSYVAVGSTSGDVNVFETASGSRLAHVAPIKVSGPVKACGISADCRHLLAVLGNGFIFRYEYRTPEADKENASDNKASDMDWQPQEEVR